MLLIVGAALYAAVTGPFRGDWGADTYKHHITHALVRKLVTRFNRAQLQYVGHAAALPDLLIPKQIYCPSLPDRLRELLQGAKG